VPNPIHFQLPDDSYFGYAVSSGYFYGVGSTKLLYVASAPQANLQTGEVHIFDIINLSSFPNSEKAIKSHFRFGGHQIGEYFGYTLLTEDFDGDGFPDLAISAPFHSKDREEENGVVYIYKNEGAVRAT
jgi:FG-GAP repeat